jgi:hypothetical protein
MAFIGQAPLLVDRRRSKLDDIGATYR